MTNALAIQHTCTTPRGLYRVAQAVGLALVTWAERSTYRNAPVLAEDERTRRLVAQLEAQRLLAEHYSNRPMGHVSRWS